MRFDVETIVIGGGVMGCAAARSLALRGQDVCLLEQFEIGHDRGSSHGASRILRFAYFEHPDYARLVRDVHPMWRQLEEESGTRIMFTCGGVDIGPEDGELVAGSKRACDDLGLKYEYLDEAGLCSRFPFVHTDRVFGVYQPDACILAADVAVGILADQAREHGANLRERSTVIGYDWDDDGVMVRMMDGSLRAKTVVVTAGPWATTMLSDLGLRMIVRRKVVGYFDPASDRDFALGEFPVFIYQTGDSYFYGFPRFGGRGVKIGDHLGGQIVDPDHVDRRLLAEDENHIRGFVASHLPAADGPLVRHDTCLYTMTPTGDFIIDCHPDSERVIVAAGFSGHGFKFAPIVGEILADLSQAGRTTRPIERFRIRHH
jgi:sarcosine oxidase